MKSSVLEKMNDEVKKNINRSKKIMAKNGINIFLIRAD